jgi:dihydroneopterin aldolase
MDIIYINDLRAEAVIGVFDWERRITQTLRFDIELGTDIRKAAASDALDDTINYKAVAKRVIAYVQQSGFQLVETLAERLAQVIIEEFGVAWVRLRVNKAGAVRHARDVGVIIERGTRT